MADRVHQSWLFKSLVHHDKKFGANLAEVVHTSRYCQLIKVSELSTRDCDALISMFSFIRIERLINPTFRSVEAYQTRHIGWMSSLMWRRQIGKSSECL